ncbi:hypothetical protein ACFOOM_00920 [Streptomyces echinoruber]|uniref:Uncharacterized protein n=1 Tax=Streptomyces echinoruber TaxID=68898 RepID=A0A918QVY7_9ACTN|nr:hypothetical protein [Streptomyces echinoruber]GGZ73249.1 hypothetical protein GCM10010389_08500 [Streptomyces echinoruber]
MLRQLTAAAARYTVKTANIGGSQRKKPDEKWQTEAWEQFREVPEVRFSGEWVGNAMSGAVLYAGRRNDDGTVERAPDDHLAMQIVKEIAGGPDGQASLLGDFGVQLVVAGEGWIVVQPKTDDDTTGDGPEYSWHVLSKLEIREENGGKLIAEIDGKDVEIPALDDETVDAPDAPIAIRVWKPFPGRHIEADSPIRASLHLLEQLQLLNAAISAIARSRITGRGVLLVPKGTRFPTQPGQTGDAEDDLIEIFLEVAATAIREPDSAAATVPIVLEVPAESISDIKWLSFESTFDELAIRLREETIRRIANAVEVPSEILLGHLGDVNHWGAWALTAEAIRLGVEPRLRIVCHALTTQWLRPMLKAQNAEDADDWLVWFDTSQLRVQANRAQTALEAYQAGLISAAAARRETGFDEADAPDGEDQQDQNPPDDTAPDDTSNDPDEETQNNVSTLPVGETTSIPDTLPASAAPRLPDGLVAAADALIWAALAAAGDRLRNKPACPRSERARAREIKPGELHTVFPVDPDQIDAWHLLDGAWVRVPEVAHRYGIDGPCLVLALDEYARALIAARKSHRYEETEAVLRFAKCLGLAA